MCVMYCLVSRFPGDDLPHNWTTLEAGLRLKPG